MPSLRAAIRALGAGALLLAYLFLFLWIWAALMPEEPDGSEIPSSDLYAEEEVDA